MWSLNARSERSLIFGCSTKPSSILSHVIGSIEPVVFRADDESCRPSRLIGDPHVLKPRTSATNSLWRAALSQVLAAADKPLRMAFGAADTEESCFILIRYDETDAFAT